MVIWQSALVYTSLVDAQDAWMNEDEEEEGGEANSIQESRGEKKRERKRCRKMRMTEEG